MRAPAAAAARLLSLSPAAAARFLSLNQAGHEEATSRPGRATLLLLLQKHLSMRRRRKLAARAAQHGTQGPLHE